jgi:hypothetical protein
LARAVLDPVNGKTVYRVGVDRRLARDLARMALRASRDEMHFAEIRGRVSADSGHGS